MDQQGSDNSVAVSAAFNWASSIGNATSTQLNVWAERSVTRSLEIARNLNLSNEIISQLNDPNLADRIAESIKPLQTQIVDSMNGRLNDSWSFAEQSSWASKFDSAAKWGGTAFSAYQAYDAAMTGSSIDLGKAVIAGIAGFIVTAVVTANEEPVLIYQSVSQRIEKNIDHLFKF